MPGVDEAAGISALGGGAVAGSSGGFAEIANLFGNAGSIIGNVAGIGGALFGSGSKSKTKSSTSATRAETGLITEQTQVEQAGLDKIIRDILSNSNGGIGDIFSKENVAGIFDSSVSAQASGNLVANLAGEIAKLTAKKEVSKVSDVSQTATSKSKTKNKKKGLFG